MYHEQGNILSITEFSKGQLIKREVPADPKDTATDKTKGKNDE